MQPTVERYSENRPSHATFAVNPSRSSPSFNDTALQEVVDTISRRPETWPEILNFEVE
ncbi:hypothetical protein M407DRAFT_55317, partial [Tulasnella calospora MUT 4182]